MSKDLVAESCFFRDLSENTAQSEEMGFGPVLNNEITQYRVTGKFSTDTEIKAYAVCTGQVFLQPNEDPQKLNVILKPFKQPISGLSIKYFIYRGLKKTDFIPVGDKNLVAYDNIASATEFIKTIWNQLVKFDEEASTINFEAKWIGYDPANQNADTQIDEYFFMADAFNDEENESLKAYEFPMINIGTQLGNFIGDHGLDIVLSDGDYKTDISSTGFQFNLTYARKSECIIDLASIPQDSTEKQYKESIHHFMDPAAFWGLHHNDQSKVITRSGTSKSEKRKDIIYHDVLSQFSTRNKVYINIQGDFNRSYNYFNSFTNILENEEVIKIGTTPETLNNTFYETHKWPILISDTEQGMENDFNIIHLQFLYQPDTTPTMYLPIGNHNIADNKKFLKDELLTQDESLSETTNQEYFTRPIGLYIPSIEVASAKRNISTWIKILYSSGDLTAINQNTTTNERVLTLNTLFGTVSMNKRFSSGSRNVISWSTFIADNLISPQQVDPQSPKGHMLHQVKYVVNLIAKTIGETTQIHHLVMYETQLSKVFSEGLYQGKFSAAEVAATGYNNFVLEENNSYHLAEPNYLNIRYFTDNLVTLKGIIIQNYNKQYPNKFILAIDKSQDDNLKALAQASNLKNGRVYFDSLSSVDSFLIDQNGQPYKKYKLGIVGDHQGSLKIIFPETEIIVYTLDSRVYFSKEYSLLIEETNNQQFDLTIDKTI